jgi:hypothetical protein
VGVDVLVSLPFYYRLYHPISSYVEKRPKGYRKLSFLDRLDGYRHREHVRHLLPMEGRSQEGLTSRFFRGGQKIG